MSQLSLRTVDLPETPGLRLLEREIAGFQILADLVAWALPRGLVIERVTVQDEFTHDVVIAGFPDRRALVFDST